MEQLTYNPTDINNVLAQYERIKSQAGGDFWTPKVGRNLIRILPPWKPGALFWRESSVHWNVGPDSKMITCIKKELNQDCYICEVVERLQNSQDPRDQAVAADMRANIRVFFNIVDLDNVEKGVQVYTSGVKILQDILAYFADPDWGDITHPEMGYDIVIDREGTTRENTKYQVRARKNPTPVPNVELLAGLKNLDSFVKILTREQQAAIYEGMSLEEAEEQFGVVSPGKVPSKSQQSSTAQSKIQVKVAKLPHDTKQPAGPAIGDELKGKIEKAQVNMPACFGKFLDKNDAACQHCAVQNACDEKMNPKPKAPVRQPVASEQLSEQLGKES
jgi:hypothetical protein